jgi:hypothetical protein
MESSWDAVLHANLSSEEPISIVELQGLGRDIWQGQDAQEYVDSERSAWNG